MASTSFPESMLRGIKDFNNNNNNIYLNHLQIHVTQCNVTFILTMIKNRNHQQ